MKRRKRRTDDEDDIGPIGKRKPKRNFDLEKRLVGGVGRFPPRADGSPALGFATLGHNNLKTWNQVAKAQGHNERHIDVPNVEDERPEPIELLQGAEGTYKERIKDIFDAKGVPHKIRKNCGAIAVEDVYGASPEYWNRDGDWREKPLEELLRDPVIVRAFEFARKEHGDLLASVSLHIDERSPHIHVVSVPLTHKWVRPRGPKPKSLEKVDGHVVDTRGEMKWSLDVSSTRWAPEALAKRHDRWAAVCEDLGLVRGIDGRDLSPNEKRDRRHTHTGKASQAGEKVRRAREDRLKEADAKAAAIVKEAEITAARIKAEARQSTAKLENELSERISDAEFTSKQAEREKDDLRSAMNSLARFLRHDADDGLSLTPEMFSHPNKMPKEVLDFAHVEPSLTTACFDLLELVAKFNQRNVELKAKEKDFSRRNARLNEATKSFNDKVVDLRKIMAKAAEFEEVFAKIPEDERAPRVKQALHKAEGLTIDDIPPGWPVPGKGGYGRD
ncbi:plasmid recombination protein [Sphingomicrobium arenosum]|uniref:plasmid recombination protein n=1 Tax=Sphingomicrobium arenosum TaxID=2233861 RepID=UPI002240FFC3|nr:plasmid recombination protein [Sphingomicrobium arenosum]